MHRNWSTCWWLLEESAAQVPSKLLFLHLLCGYRLKGHIRSYHRSQHTLKYSEYYCICRVVLYCIWIQLLAPNCLGRKTSAVTRLRSLLLRISCQGETVIAVTMLNELGGDGDQLLNTLATVISRIRKIPLVRNSICLVIVHPWMEGTEHIDQNTI